MVHDIPEIRRRLADARALVERLEQELRHAVSDFSETSSASARGDSSGVPQAPEAKIALFLDLFGTRKDVYPKRWENQSTGRSGYSPACLNEWRTGICEKPRVKCIACAHQKFPPLNEEAVEAHLLGRAVLGVYAVTADHRCKFLAADFDGEGWQENALAFRQAAEGVGVAVAIERSRSGSGAHTWIFFSEPVAATQARRLGMLLLGKASAMCPTMDVSAFDRLFPNQDFVAEGGFGNLIALPLAKASRRDGNTVFLDFDLMPIADQWAYLARLERVTPEALDGAIQIGRAHV